MRQLIKTVEATKIKAAEANFLSQNTEGIDAAQSWVLHKKAKWTQPPKSSFLKQAVEKFKPHLI